MSILIVNENCVYYCSNIIPSLQINMNCLGEFINDAELLVLREEINGAESDFKVTKKQQEELEVRTKIKRKSREIERELKEERHKAEKYRLIEVLKKRKLTGKEEAVSTACLQCGCVGPFAHKTLS